MYECIYIEIWYLDRDIERCIIDYENRNEMLNWRLWKELLGETLNVVDDILTGNCKSALH